MGKSHNILDKHVKKPLKKIKSLDTRYYIQREPMRMFNFYDQRKFANAAQYNHDRLSESIPVLREYINSICTQLRSSTDNYQRYDILRNVTTLFVKFNILKYLNRTLESLIISDSLKNAIEYVGSNLETYESLKNYRSECNDLANEVINFTAEYAGLEAILFAAPDLNIHEGLKRSKSF